MGALCSQLVVIVLRYKWNTSQTLVTWTKQLLLHLASLTQIVVLDEVSIMVVLSSESVVIMLNFFTGVPVIAWVELIQVMVLSCPLVIIWVLYKVKFEQSVIMKLLLHFTISITFVVLVKGRIMGVSFSHLLFVRLRYKLMKTKVVIIHYFHKMSGSPSWCDSNSSLQHELVNWCHLSHISHVWTAGQAS